MSEPHDGGGEQSPEQTPVKGRRIDWTDPIWTRTLRRTSKRPEILAVIRAENGCAIWQGADNGNGHAMNQGRPVYRWYYEYFHGPIPARMECHHLCDNGLCVNPQHILLVTREEHMRIERAGRRPFFKKRKLDEAQVIEILELLERGETIDSIAVRFGVSDTLISMIRNGLRWATVVERYRSRETKEARQEAA